MSTDHDIKDINLAPAGRLRMAWAEREIRAVTRKRYSIGR